MELACRHACEDEEEDVLARIRRAILESIIFRSELATTHYKALHRVGARNTTQIAVRERRKRKTCAGLESNPRPLAHAPALDAFAAARGALSTSDNTHSRTRVTWTQKRKVRRKVCRKVCRKVGNFVFLPAKNHMLCIKKRKKKGKGFSMIVEISC